MNKMFGLLARDTYHETQCNSYTTKPIINLISHTTCTHTNYILIHPLKIYHSLTRALLDEHTIIITETTGAIHSHKNIKTIIQTIIQTILMKTQTINIRSYMQCCAI